MPSLPIRVPATYVLSALRLGIHAALATLLLGGCAEPPVHDPSLAVAEYAEAGVPAPTGAWTTEQYAQAAAALEVLGAERPDALPRAESEVSGRVFRRLVSSDLFAPLRDSSVSLGDRWTERGQVAAALHRMVGVYRRAGGETADYAREEVELMGSSLALLAVSLDVVAEFETRLGAGSSQQQAWEHDIERVRTEIADQLHAMLLLLDEIDDPRPASDVALDAARRLARRLADSVPRVIQGLAPQQRDAVIEEIQALGESTPDPQVAASLRRLLQAAADTPD